VRRVRHVTLGLAALGIKAGDRVALLSENRPEWSITDLAILSLGAVNVPIYTTQAVDQVEFILTDSGTRAIFISGRKVFKHARQAIENLPLPVKLIFFDEEAAEDVNSRAAELNEKRLEGDSAVPVSAAITLATLEAGGAEQDREQPQAFDELISQIRPDDLATIIYTSGTTGEPKGVMLNHQSFISNVSNISHELPIGPADVALSVLPLSHIFERTGFYIFCNSGVSVYYCGSFDQVGEHLREVRPTVMTAVPRLFEAVYHRIMKKGLSAKGWRKKVFLQALEVGHRYAELQDKHQSVPRTLALRQKIADKLVFTKWREGVGGRLRYFVSGGAPLSPTLSYAFLAAGIPILQGYGATETCIVSANRPDNNRVGSIGIPFSGIDVAIAEDGEIMLRGPNVMVGYYGHPDATAQVLKDGWFATGDVGHIDDEGRLYITDRKKDLFAIERRVHRTAADRELDQRERVRRQVVVVGASRKQPVALIVPDWDSLKSNLATTEKEVPRTHGELSRHPVAIKLVQADVARLTAGLADYERIRKVALLPDELTIDNGELTPTLKVKRRVIDEKFGYLIEELYA
jgi:long-chain acyl-CoA synthetase